MILRGISERDFNDRKCKKENNLCLVVRMCLLIEKNAIKLGVEEATAFAGLETKLRGSKCSFFRLPRHGKWCEDSRIGIPRMHFGYTLR